MRDQVDILLTVDPGYAGTGVAYFLALGHKFPKAPSTLWTLRSKDKKAHKTRLDFELVDQFEMLLRRLISGPTRIVIEFPNLWSGSKVSMASAGSGNLFALAALCGAYAARANTVFGVEAEFIRPQEWKGQLPKDVVKRRLIQRWPVLSKTVSEHALDAAGMGLFLQAGQL